MFSDSRLEEISATESQPVANRLLAELIIEERRTRAELTALLAILPDAMDRPKAEAEQKPAVVIKKKGGR